MGIWFEVVEVFLSYRFLLLCGLGEKVVEYRSIEVSKWVVEMKW